jgi:hypothetical protein
VACPFFMPVGRLDHDVWINPPRLPLGDPYRGVCHAHAADVFEPLETAQRDLCNCGYARGRCQRFPEDSAADAVRFSITGDRDGLVRLVYVVEKNHAPAEHGALEYAVDEARLLNNHTSELLAGQANAFLQSYLRRRV